MRNRLIPLIVAGVIVVSACSAIRPKPALNWHLTVEIDPSVSNRKRLLSETIAVLQKRLDAYGVSHSTLEPVGNPENGLVRINLPGGSDPERLKNFIVSPGSLQIVHVISEQSAAANRIDNRPSEIKASSNDVKALSPNQRLLAFPEESVGRHITWVVAEFPPIIDSGEVRGAVAAAEAGSKYMVNFNLTSKGGEKFAAWTAANINQSVGVVVDGTVNSIAVIRAPMSTTPVKFQEKFTKQSAEDLAHILNTGPLPAPLKIVKEEIN